MARSCRLTSLVDRDFVACTEWGVCMLQGSSGGTNQKRMVAQWPALAGRKISQTVFTLDPCALRPAHVHQRGDGILYLISGAL